MAVTKNHLTISEVLNSVSKEDYGESYQAHVLSMYKDFVVSAEAVSNRRANANKFFLPINIGLLGVYNNFLITNVNYVLLSALAGIAFSLIWLGLISSYKSLNRAKFKVIQEIEQHLPLSPYKAEEYVYQKPKKGMQALSRYESYMPLVFIAAYFVMFIAVSLWVPDSALVNWLS